MNIFKKISNFFFKPILPDIKYQSKPFILILRDRRSIQYDHGTTKVISHGWSNLTDSIIEVEYEFDKNGEPVPDMDTFGHEVWHMFVGKFHE